MSDEINETIIKMVKTFKPTSNPFEFNTPILKRTLSMHSTSESSGTDEPSVKKTKLSSVSSARPKMDPLYIGSPREVRRIRADLVEARNTILNLENRISHMHNVRKQMQIMFDNETTSLKKQQEYDRKSIEELEAQLQTIRKRETDLKHDLVELKNKYDLLKLANDSRTEDLEKSLTEIKEESRYFEGQESIEVSRLNRRIVELESVLQAAEEDGEAHKKLALELEKQLAEKNNIERSLELKEQALQKAKMQIKELEYAKENFLEFQEQAKTQAYKIHNYVDMEKENELLKSENVRLKEEIRNKLLLEEEVHDLKTRIQKYKERDEKYAELQVQQAQNEMNLSEWRAVARGICETTESDSALPHLMRGVVEHLQHQEIALTSEKVDLETKLKSALHDYKVSKAELDKCNKLLTDLKTTNDQKQNLIHRMQKKLLLISRERDSYRLQLDSYEKELTICHNPSSSGSGSSPLLSQRGRIENLERVIDGYRDMVSKLETDLQTAQPGISLDVVSVKADQVKRLHDDLDKLKMENDRLRDRNDQLEVQLEMHLVGNDTLKGGQVYHLATNPLSEYLTQRENLIEKLEQDIEKLKRKVKNYEEGIETSKIGEISICPQEVNSLKEQLKSQETQTQRMKELFKSSMQEFRNVIYMLFGYKIDRTSNTLYKLRSIYAERAEDQIVFQVNQMGELSMCQSDFTEALTDLIETNLNQHKSIPVFLSSLTIELFNTRTSTFQID